VPRTYLRRAGERTPQPSGPTEQIGRSQRVPVPKFYDPYFFIQGSIPEKMVMKELVRRGIWFEHTPQENGLNWENSPSGDLTKLASSDPTKWEADFLFPQYKIWLEVQGHYFHTLPGVREKEALRFVLIEAAGWRPIYWWDYDIEARLPDLMNEVPEFYRPVDWFAAEHNTNRGYDMTVEHNQNPRAAHGWTKAGTRNDGWKDTYKTYGNLPFIEGGTGIDHLKGLRTANSNRATTPQYNSRWRKSYTRKPK